jgi:hypothetical protein
MQNYRDASTERHSFLSRFKTLCKVYGLTYSEAIFHPYRFKGNVELEFIISGYRLGLFDFNEFYADSMIHLLTTFAENNKEIPENDKTNLDVVMKYLHKEFSYHSYYPPLALDYDVEYRMWEEYYKANNESIIPFYLEQDLDVLSIHEISELAGYYERYVAKLAYNDDLDKQATEKEMHAPFADQVAEGLTGAITGNNWQLNDCTPPKLTKEDITASQNNPSYDYQPVEDEDVERINKLREERFNKFLTENKATRIKDVINATNSDLVGIVEPSIHKSKFPVEQFLSDEKLARIAEVVKKVNNPKPTPARFRPKPRPLEERYAEVIANVAVTERYFGVKIPQFKYLDTRLEPQKNIVKEKIMQDFEKWLNAELIL